MVCNNEHPLGVATCQKSDGHKGNHGAWLVDDVVTWEQDPQLSKNEIELQKQLNEATSIIEDCKNLADLAIQYDLLDTYPLNDMDDYNMQDRINRAWKTCERVNRFLKIPPGREHFYEHPNSLAAHIERQGRILDRMEQLLGFLSDKPDGEMKYVRYISRNGLWYLYE